MTPEVLRPKLWDLMVPTSMRSFKSEPMDMVRLAAAAELWLAKPVIPIDTATYWHALRQNGITEKVQGFGRLLEEF